MIKRSALTFGITSHNEGESLRTLVTQLLEHTEFPIVILDDNSTDSDTVHILESFRGNDRIQIHTRPLNRDFAAQKNHLTTLCDSEYIFQLDADETLADNLIQYIPTILRLGVELFMVPRINTVQGLTQEDIQRWGWQVNEQGWVMFPDYQTRLYKKSDTILWMGAVHERIVGYKTFSMLPAEPDFAILHHKTIERQRKQNEFYQTI